MIKRKNEIEIDRKSMHLEKEKKTFKRAMIRRKNEIV